MKKLKEQQKHTKIIWTKILNLLKRTRIVKIFQRTKRRTIYEVIDTDYIQNSNIFPISFITKCKLYPNEPQFITQDVKNNVKHMEMEQSLYAQVIKFRRKDLKFDAAD